MRSAMSFYEQTLQQVVDATGDGKSYRDDPQPLTARLKAGEVYASGALTPPATTGP